MRRTRLLMVAAAVACAGAAAQVVTPPPIDFPPGTAVRPPSSPPRKPEGPAIQDGRVATFEEMQQARLALEELIRAYETGDIALFERRLAPNLIGYQILLDGIRQNIAAQRNVRIQLLDTQITAGPDLTVVETSWEKRFLDAATFQPVLQTGRSTILLSRRQADWQLAAIAGDSLFAQGAGTLAQILVTPETFLSPPGGCASGVCPPVLIEISDPDFAGQAFVQAEVLSADGDRETLVLNAIAPGRFAAPNVAVEIGAAFTPIPNNGVLTLRAAPGTQAQFVVRFLDPSPGSNRPPSLLAKAVRVQVPAGAPPGGPIKPPPTPGTLATISAVPLVVKVPFTATTGPVPLQLTVVDPDLTGSPSVVVQATASNGDVESLILPAIIPGTFQISSFQGQFNPPIAANNGFISIASGNTVTFRFVDTTSGLPKPGIVSVTVTFF